MTRQARDTSNRKGRPTAHAERPGRPRSADVDQAIKETALQVLAARGYRGLSVEGVARESGIAKTSVYRRYRDKQDMAAAALAYLLERHGAFESTTSGDTRRDLVLAVRQISRAEGTSIALGILFAMLAEHRGDDTAAERLSARVFAPHRAAVAEILRRGVQRGELRDDLALDTAVELVVGGFLARVISGPPADDAWIERMVATLWDGLAR